MAKETKTGSKTAAKKTATKKTTVKKAAVKKTVAKTAEAKKPAEKKAAPKTTVAQKQSAPKGIKKQYLKAKDLCQVTFCLPGEAATGAECVTIVGDFNDWNLNAHPMEKLETGDFTLTMLLPIGRDYRFRYLIDNTKWENDWAADRYEPNMHAEEDSVVII